MTLRRMLALRYAVVVSACLLLVAGMAYHEFVVEPHLRQRLGLAEQPELAWLEWAEVFFYAMIPVILAGGWWFMRKSLAPLNTFAQQVEQIHLNNLCEPLSRTGNGDEVDRLAEAFNGMTSRLLQAFQQIREFTLYASHELKTPLTVMRAQVEMAQREADTAATGSRDWLQSQIEEIDRLTKIVDGLTLLTKAEAGQITLEWEPVWLAELVRESFEDAQILAEPRGVRVALLECADVVTLGDRHRLRQVLLNLADNAIKYNQPQGSVTMALRAAGDEAEIELTNTGAGIPAELQARVFDRFVRGDEARKNAIEGCGLGLSIIRWIVQAHCGTIRIASEPGRLTTVVVRLPRVDRNAGRPPAANR